LADPFHGRTRNSISSNEGIRLVLPTSTFVYIPSPAFQQAVMANITQVSPAQSSFYKSLFQGYNQASGASYATGIVGSSDPSGCNNQVLVIKGVQFGSGAAPAKL
jgi:hypothetical protein